MFGHQNRTRLFDEQSRTLMKWPNRNLTRRVYSRQKSNLGDQFLTAALILKALLSVKLFLVDHLFAEL